jgi:hypothetical protein
LCWSERQAALLRLVAVGERINDQVDWQNVIEKIESVGNEQLHAVESLLVQALRHTLKAEAWPLHRDAPNWRAGAIDFRQHAQRRYAPSMRRRIDMERIWRHAQRGLPETQDGTTPLPINSEMPSLDELLSEP